MISRRVIGAARAALSHGPGYEPQPVNANAVYDGAPRGYFLDLRRKTEQDQSVVDGRGRDISASPTLLAQRALGWYERLNDDAIDGEQAFRHSIDALLGASSVAVGKDGRQVLLWTYSAAAPKYHVRPPWLSAMAQAQAASALVRAAEMWPAEPFAEMALAAVRPLTTDVDQYRLTVATPFGPALEEYPSPSPSLVLNGWIYAAWGVWDVAHSVGDDKHLRLFETTVDALEAMLPRYDGVWWSRYSLFSPAAPDLAKPFYHRLHIDQLHVMARLTGRVHFADAARRWSAYDSSLAAARAVGAICRARMRGTAFAS